MPQFKPAVLDTKAKFMTTLYYCICVALPLFNFDWPLWGKILFPTVMIGIVTPFAIRGYSFTETDFVIHRVGWQTTYPLAKLTKAEGNPMATGGSIRTFGIGGVYGYIGRFRNAFLGSYYAYLTHGLYTIVMDFTDHNIVVSPHEIPDFLDHAQQIIRQNKKSI